MVCGNDLGKQEEKMQARLQSDKRKFNLHKEWWGMANISDGIIPRFFFTVKGTNQERCTCRFTRLCYVTSQ